MLLSVLNVKGLLYRIIYVGLFTDYLREVWLLRGPAPSKLPLGKRPKQIVPLKFLFTKELMPNICKLEHNEFSMAPMQCASVGT